RKADFRHDAQRSRLSRGNAGAGELELRRKQSGAAIIGEVEIPFEAAAREAGADAIEADAVLAEDQPQLRIREFVAAAKVELRRGQLDLAGKGQAGLRREGLFLPAVTRHGRAGAARDHGKDRLEIGLGEAQFARPSRLRAEAGQRQPSFDPGVGDLPVKLLDIGAIAPVAQPRRQVDRRAPAQTGDRPPGGGKPSFALPSTAISPCRAEALPEKLPRRSSPRREASTCSESPGSPRRLSTASAVSDMPSGRAGRPSAASTRAGSASLRSEAVRDTGP